MSADHLIIDIQKEQKKWARSTMFYAACNGIFRVLLILASGIVAAQNNLKESPASFLVRWVPILALGVTILTALDSWLKPRDKWRGFMEGRDHLSDLLLRAQATQSADLTYSDNLRKEFAELRERHRNKNVY
jgi:hypothetical protein